MDDEISVNITLVLPRDLLHQIDSIREGTRENRSAYIRRALTDFLDASSSTPKAGGQND